MITVALDKDQYGITWIDIESPTESDLKSVAETYGLHKTAVADCLQPTHLPKFEQFDQVFFLIARAYDMIRSNDGETVQELTNKLAVFVGPDFIITIHRTANPYLENIRTVWQTKSKKISNVTHLLNDLLKGVISTYAQPIENCDERLSKLEKAAFAAGSRFPYREGYIILRKASVMKRILWMNLEVIRRLPQMPDQSRTFFQDLTEETQRQLVVIEETVESVRSVINMHVAISGQRMNEASYKTSEIMRVLTLFSLLFLPLNFVAGVYGMNFEHIPWLKEEWGFYGSIGLMLAFVVSIFAWFKKKGWLKRADYH